MGELPIAIFPGSADEVRPISSNRRRWLNHQTDSRVGCPAILSSAGTRVKACNPSLTWQHALDRMPGG